MTDKLKTMSKSEKIEYYKNRNDIVTIATGNTKLGSKICGLSLPAGVTCREDAPCRSICYCNKGFQILPVVIGAYLKNYRIYTINPNSFFQQVCDYLQKSKYKYMRVFDSGDLPDKEFLPNLIQKVILPNPDIKFLMFTKRYEWVNEYMDKNEVPSNFRIVFSHWDKNWKVPNPHNLACSYVSFKDNSLNPNIPENSLDCLGHCSNCFRCWNLKDGENILFKQH